MERIPKLSQSVDSDVRDRKLLNNNFINNDCAITSTSLILFIFQSIVILLIICVSAYNLTINSGDSNLWTALLSSSLGYVLPNPKLKYTETKS